MIFFAERHDELAGGRLLGLAAWAGAGGKKELTLGIVAKLVTEHAKGARGVAEVAGRQMGREALDKEGPERLVLPLLGVVGAAEEVFRIG
ncbi:MAG: hypothetical protein ABIQ35_07515 [Verrucomicrobiota bacterium]